MEELRNIIIECKSIQEVDNMKYHSQEIPNYTIDGDKITIDTKATVKRQQAGKKLNKIKNLSSEVEELSTKAIARRQVKK